MGAVRRVFRAASAIGARVTHRRRKFRKRRPVPPPFGEDYPGDFVGRADITYRPEIDGDPDPGEIVWTWVPYEEDHRRGKDRPVLLLGHDEPWLVGAMLSSQDHDRDAKEEARHGRSWMDVGSGAWDSRGRPSEVRLDRLIRVHPDHVRREGAVLDRVIFDEAVARIVELKGW